MKEDMNKEVKIPEVIVDYLERNKNIRNIFLHFDNDITGIKTAKSYIKYFSNTKYIVSYNPAPFGKDINDYLCVKKGLKAKNELQKMDKFSKKEVQILK